MDLTFIVFIIILIFSIIAHELAHGYSADFLGDPTPRLMGRLTTNPLAHLEFFGSFLVPLIAYFAGGFIFGWAKPVMFNPYNLKNQKWGEAIVAVAGPATNIVLAIIFSIILRFSIALSLSPNLIFIFGVVVLVNIILACFNLVPIPPLDGSKILFAVLPIKYLAIREKIEQGGFLLVLVFIFFFWGFVTPLIHLIFKILTGVSFIGL